MDNQLKNDIELIGIKARYDEQCKKLISNKQILAWILKYSAEEYKDCTIDQIVDYIAGEPQISSVGVDPGHTSESIKALANEDISLSEGKITYDIRFEANAPDEDGGIIRLIINVEAQNAFKPEYPLLKRAVYYCSRMLSAQKGLEFHHSEYNKIKKVYSIWICSNPPESHKSTITRYKITEENVIGSVKEKKQHYDLMNIIMICLGNGDKESDTVIGLLETLLTDTSNAKDRIEVLEKEFEIKMSDDYESEVAQMCNLSDGVYNNGMKQGMEQGMEQGMAQGMEQGMAQGVIQGKLEILRNIMATGVPVDKAMDMLLISEDERQVLKDKIKN